VPVFWLWLLFDPRRIPRCGCQARQPACVIVTLITACLYLLLIGRLVNYSSYRDMWRWGVTRAVPPDGCQVHAICLRRHMSALYQLHKLCKSSAVIRTTYRELKRNCPRPARPSSPAGPKEDHEILIILYRSRCREPIPVVTQSKAYVCGRSIAGIADPNPTEGMDYPILLCVV
jgi:hypothetical protein